MAVTARRTLANVKSSAISPRHPEVPNLIGEELIALYSSPESEESKAFHERVSFIREGIMVAGKQNRIVLVTCGSIVEARKIATAVVRKRLAACVNLVLAPIQSIY